MDAHHLRRIDGEGDDGGGDGIPCYYYNFFYYYCIHTMYYSTNFKHFHSELYFVSISSLSSCALFSRSFHIGSHGSGDDGGDSGGGGN